MEYLLSPHMRNTDVWGRDIEKIWRSCPEAE
jgi:hypothetical protein